MNIKAEKFYNELKGKKVAFIGAGVSHKQLIEIFAKKGAVVTLCDKKELEGFGEYAETLKELNINLSLGENYLEGLKNQDLIMRTPGLNFSQKNFRTNLKAAQKLQAKWNFSSVSVLAKSML